MFRLDLGDYTVEELRELKFIQEFIVHSGHLTRVADACGIAVKTAYNWEHKYLERIHDYPRPLTRHQKRLDHLVEMKRLFATLPPMTVDDPKRDPFVEDLDPKFEPKPPREGRSSWKDYLSQ